jgi:hypothetical protein
MTTQVKKPGRKSNAELAAIAATEAAKTQELAKVEVIDGEKVVTDLEPVSKAPVTLSVDADGEDLGDVTNTTPETPVIESGELVETFSGEVQGTSGTEVTELPEGATREELAELFGVTLTDEPVDESLETKFNVKFDEDAFTPILVPTMVGDERKGHIPCPKDVFQLVQVEGWQDLIDDQPAHIKAGLKSVLHWQNINGTVKVRCQSSSRFADVV